MAGSLDSMVVRSFFSATPFPVGAPFEVVSFLVRSILAAPGWP